MTVIPRSFYDRSPLLVAPELLGKVIVRQLDGKVISGRIVEVEAYLAENDQAAHGFRGKTRANQSLFKAAGHAYVHRIHMQHCLDLVTGAQDVPSSVLIRALEPLAGLELMRQFRGKTQVKDLTSGPGKLAQALQITTALDGVDVTTTESPLHIVDDGFKSTEVVTTKRVGISKAQELELRFYLKNNPYISKR